MALLMLNVVLWGAPPASQPEGTHFEIKISPFIDMHYWIKSMAASGAKTGVPNEKVGHAVDLARHLEQELGGALMWGLIEGLWIDANSADEAAELSKVLGETVRLRNGRTVELRFEVKELCAAYKVIEPYYLKEVWPGHKTEVESRMARLEKELLPQQQECFAYLLKSLNMKDPQKSIPVFLVGEAPFPGSVTHRRKGDAGVCFIGPQDTEGTLLAEVVLHESIHALDVSTQDQPTALKKLREALTHAGLKPTDKAFRDTPHTLMFVQAAATVRKVLDPKHRDYGDVAGYYAKVPEATKAVRDTWQEHLDGKIDLDDAVKEIVSKSAAK